MAMTAHAAAHTQSAAVNAGCTRPAPVRAAASAHAHVKSRYAHASCGCAQHARFPANARRSQMPATQRKPIAAAGEMPRSAPPSARAPSAHGDAAKAANAAPTAAAGAGVCAVRNVPNNAAAADAPAAGSSAASARAHFHAAHDPWTGLGRAGRSRTPRRIAQARRPGRRAARPQTLPGGNARMDPPHTRIPGTGPSARAAAAAAVQAATRRA